MHTLKPLYRPYSIGQSSTIVGTSIGFLDGGDSYFYVHVSSGYLHLYLLDEVGHISQVGEISKCDVFTILSLSDPNSSQWSLLQADPETIQAGTKPLCIVLAAAGNVVCIYTVTIDRNNKKNLWISMSAELSLVGPVSCLATNGAVLVASIGTFICAYELGPLLAGDTSGPQAPIKISTSNITDLYFCRNRPTELLFINLTSELGFLNLDINGSQREVLFGSSEDVSDDIFLFGSAYPFPLGVVYYSTEALCMTTGPMGMALADPEDGAILYQNMDIRPLAKSHDYILSVHKADSSIFVTCGRFSGAVTVFKFSDGAFTRHIVFLLQPASKQTERTTHQELSPAGVTKIKDGSTTDVTGPDEQQETDLSVRSIAWGRGRALLLDCTSTVTAYELAGDGSLSYMHI